MTSGAADHTLHDPYTDDSGVDVASIDNSDIRVTGPTVSTSRRLGGR